MLQILCLPIQHLLVNIKLFGIIWSCTENASKFEWGAGITRKIDIFRLRALLSPTVDLLLSYYYYFLIFPTITIEQHLALQDLPVITWMKNGKVACLRILRTSPVCWGKGGSLLSPLSLGNADHVVRLYPASRIPLLRLTSRRAVLRSEAAPRDAWLLALLGCCCSYLLWRVLKPRWTQWLTASQFPSW